MAISSGASAQRPHQTHYTLLDGLPQGQVWSVFQSSGGYMWFGTYGGLSRYNGSDFRTWTAADGLSANLVTALAEDARGRLVVGTRGGGVCFMKRERFECLSSAEGLVGDTVLDLMVSADRSLWVVTAEGVTRQTDEPMVHYVPGAGLPLGEPRVLLQDGVGRVWLGTSDGLAVLRGNRFETVVADLPPVRALAELPEGLLVGTEAGVYVWDPEQRTLSGAISGLEDVFIKDAVVDRSGRLWLATRSGVALLQNQSVRFLTHDQGLLSDDTYTLFLDREGSVWVGSDGGASKFVPGPFETYTEAEGLPSSFVRAVAEDRAGRVWLGTRSGVGVVEGDRIWRITEADGLPCERVYAVAERADGTMLIGTDCGLVLWNGGLERVLTEPELPDHHVRSLLADPDGGVWVGSRTGLVRLSAEGTVVEPGSLVPADYVISLERDLEGRLWLGQAHGGVLIHDAGKTTSLSAEEGLSSETIWSMDLDREGQMWVGTNGDGVFRVAGSEIERFSVAEGLHNDFVWQVLLDRTGCVWLYTNDGLDRWDGESFAHYGLGDGLISREGSATAALEDSSGRLWFGTGFGVSVFSPSAQIVNTVLPQIVIEDVRGGELEPLYPGAAIGPHSAALSVHFAGLSFRDERAVRFRYRLLGSTSEWSPATFDRSIGFANLAPGAYEFQVTVSNEAGVWNPVPASFPFTVTPAVWQTNWFKAMAAVALLATIAAVIVLRTRKLQAERRRLEREIAKRTAEIEEKNRTLALEVAERRQAEEALQRSEQRVRNILEHTSNLFYSRDLDGRFTYLSPQVEEFLDCSPEEAKTDWQSFMTSDSINRAGLEASRTAIETGLRQPPYELKLRTKKGRDIIVSVHEAPVVHEGKAVAVVGALSDITDAKHTEAERAELEACLIQSRKMEAIGQLAGGVAHDFNNLLTTIMCSVEALVERLAGAGLELRGLEDIRNAAERGASLTKQLLAFSRKQVIQPRVVNLNAFVEQSSRILARLLGEDVELVINLDPTLDPIRADIGQLDQILMNLAANARDAMPTGGTLTIELSNVELEEPLQLGLDCDVVPGRYVLLRVSDTGCGIEETTREHIFEPFFTTKEDGAGTGLGLATVYGIVKQNHGYIVLDSERARGATFSIYLPSIDSCEPALAAAERELESRVAGTVLLVEDEDAVRNALALALERHGLEVLVAHNANAALELCRRNPSRIDLLLTDLVMPGMDGNRLAQRVAAAVPGIKVLFISGHTDDAVVRRGVETGGANFLQKPFTSSTLIDRIGGLLTAKSPHSPGAVGSPS